MSKLIIKCPICFETDNTMLNLAEYLPPGILSIRTFYKKFRNEQIPIYIQGKDFELVCGNCKQIAFRKTPILIQETTQILFGTI